MSYYHYEDPYEYEDYGNHSNGDYEYKLYLDHGEPNHYEPNHTPSKPDHYNHEHNTYGFEHKVPQYKVTG